jgi:ABC-2 type transport system ATP-binding protein
MGAPVVHLRRAAPAIETRGLGRVFGGRAAVERLDLAVEPGEIFGFLGPNGAGKTTTLRMLSTLIAPTSGAASILGRDVAAEAMPVRRLLGVMTERPGLYERLSVDANLRLWAEAHEVEAVDRAIASALDMVGLADRRQHKVSSLSKGLRQRASLARAIVHRPPVLLLDEPSSGLDPSAAIHVEAMIRSLAEQGATVFLNTHRLAEAQRLCDRVGILNTRLIAVGAPADLRQRLFGATVTVRLAGPLPDGIVSILRGLPGVRALRMERVSFDCTLGDVRHDTPTLVAALVREGAEVLEVTAAGDLEQVYLNLVGEGAANAAEELEEGVAA